MNAATRLSERYQFGFADEIDFHMGSFSKALGGQAGFVCGSRAQVEYATAFDGSCFFWCNLAPGVVADLIAGLRVVPRQPAIRAKPCGNVALVHQGLAETGIDLGGSTLQLIPARVYDEGKIFRVAAELQNRGVFSNSRAVPGFEAQGALSDLGLGGAQRGGARGRGRDHRRGVSGGEHHLLEIAVPDRTSRRALATSRRSPPT
jgi:hypothetical protein